MFVMDCYGHKLSNGVLFAYHLILDAPGGSSHLGYRRRVPPGHNPTTRVKGQGTGAERPDYTYNSVTQFYLILTTIIIPRDSPGRDFRRPWGTPI